MSEGIGLHDLADFDVDVLGEKRADFLHLRLVRRVDAERGRERAPGQQRIVGGLQRVLLVRAGRIDHRAIERHVELERGLHERRVALGDDAGEQDRQERKPEQDRGDAVEPETALGGVAARDAALDLGLGARREPGRGGSRCHGHYSYCSLYLRTM